MAFSSGLVAQLFRRKLQIMMKKLLIAVLLVTSTSAFCFEIHGAYARLVSCTWGQMGYDYGNIGIYDVNGKMYQVFFGSNWCAY